MPNAFDEMFGLVADVSIDLHAHSTTVSVRDGSDVIASGLAANVSNEEEHNETLDNGQTRRIRMKTVIFRKSASVPVIVPRYTILIDGKSWSIDEREGLGIIDTESHVEVNVRRFGDVADRPGRVV